MNRLGYEKRFPGGSNFKEFLQKIEVSSMCWLITMVGRGAIIVVDLRLSQSHLAEIAIDSSCLFVEGLNNRILSNTMFSRQSLSH